MKIKAFIRAVIGIAVLTAYASDAASQESPARNAQIRLAEGADLRILNDNIWDYSKETIPQAWQEIGEDPRDSVRAPQFERLVTDYMPDVLTLQEYSSHMHAEFYPRVQNAGYVIAWESQEDWNNTPVFYYPETLELLYVNYHKYTPEQWCNRGTKSFTSAVFKRKADGKMFALINTHLWWKSDQVQPGSTMARAAQVRLMMAEAEIIKAKFGDIPLFVTGDMNCEEDTVPMQQFITAGYIPCYKAATVYGDNNNGHHICSPKDGYSTKSRRKGPDRQTGAIDHCFILDPAETAEIKVFDCIMDDYLVKLTDHYPLLIDIRL
jgi:endonuclease/exonuclease/phosphatase family metal-dependent hydrolase